MSWLPKKCVVVPVDFSDESLAAIDVALQLVAEPAGLQVIHVLPELNVAEPGVIWDQIDNPSRCRHAEQALRDFGQKLTAQERADLLIGDDLEGIFTSPRDNEKFVVRYNARLDPSQSRAIAYESKGVNGLRYVALSIGYVVEYDEEQLKDYKK